MSSLFAGRILLAGSVVEGFVEIDQGRVVQSGTGEPPERPVAAGWIVPSLANAHTHVADTFLRDRPGKPTGIAELVGPGGWKHKELAKSKPAQVEEGVRRHVGEMAAVGTSVFCDFREEGVPGARFLRNLADDLPVRPLVYGRPAAYAFEEREADILLRLCDGIGLSGMRDFHMRDLEAWAEACRQARKPLAIHVSEDKRDPIDAVMALEPSFVVHMVHGLPDDFEELSQADVPVVACPRSNRFFSRRTPIERMLEAGCTVAVGTDNGMLQDGNLLQELGQLAQWSPDLPVEDLLRMACFGSRAALRLPVPQMPKAGEPVDLLVLPEQPLPRPATGKPGFTVAPAPPPEP